MQGLLTLRHWPGWLGASGLAMLLLFGVLLNAPTSPSDSAVLGDQLPDVGLLGDRAPEATLGVAQPTSPELAPPMPPMLLKLPQLTLLPKLSSSWLALVVALIGWRTLLVCAAASADVQQSRFPPGRRGRALLHAYLN
jgi:hypothetical protein